MPSSPNFRSGTQPRAERITPGPLIRAGRSHVTGYMHALEGTLIADALPPMPGSIGRGSLVMQDPGQRLPTAEDLARALRAVASGRDRAAFALLFNFFAPRIKAFLMRSGMAAPAAEELAQETMLAVWKKAGYFDPARASASTWIFTIARNLRIDRLRRDGRAATARDIADPSEEAEEPVTGEAVVIAAEREERVRAALDALSREQAEIVRLSYFGDRPQSEIARELGIPLGTVKSRTRLALNRLRLLLDDLA